MKHFYRTYLTRSNCDLFSEGMRGVDSSIDHESIWRTEFIAMIMGRGDVLKSMLEIGPFGGPCFGGPRVKYFDILDRNGLIKKAGVDNDASKVGQEVDISKIPEIDYIDPEGDISKVVFEKFDCAFSSHNIEHQVDLISHLRQVGDILNDNGKFYLLIPDKRYCFDHFIAETPMSDVLATHFSNPSVHDMATVLRMRCEITHNSRAHHWQGQHGRMLAHNNLNCYLEALEEIKAANGEYIDAHKWRFIPSSFEWIINSLYEMKLIPLKVEKVYHTAKGSNEFAAILCKS